MNKYKNALSPLLILLSVTVMVSSCQFLSNGQQQQQHQPQTPVTTYAPPVIEYFDASPAEIAFGSSATLSWKVTGADTIQITPEIGAVSSSGERAVMPADRMVYTLVAANSAGSSSSTAVIVVNKNLRAKAIALTEEDVIPAGFVYDRSSEPSMKNTISTYHIAFTRGLNSNIILDNTIYIYDTVPDLEKVFFDDKYNSRVYATEFIAIGTEGYVLTIPGLGTGDNPTYSLKFYKSNVYVKLTGNIPLNEVEKFARINEGRIY